MNKQRRNLATYNKHRALELSSSDDDTVFEKPPKARKSNVYDAVAGNVTQAGLIGNITDSKASRQSLRPDEVLFKQSNAPIRYEETDYYFANEKLPAGQQLPSGDLLSALHAYISRLYSRTEGPETEKAWKCMDETALIAFGILMEETAREVLGETGDLAFTEAADEEEERALAAEEKEENNDRGEHGKAAVHEEGDRSHLSISSGDSSDYSTSDSD